MMCYLGASWPEEYRGKLFIGNIHGQRLNMDIPERQGSGYVGRHGKDFINFNDTWSQTLNQLYDQDGSVYVIDWYDKNQCHHTREDGHDRSNGRIYKIVYNDQKTTKVNLQGLTDAELVKLVPSKNEWMSRHARRILQERSEKPQTSREGRMKLIAELKNLEDVFQNADTTSGRLKALWALHGCPGVMPDPLPRLLKHKDEFVRAWAIQLVCEQWNSSRVPLAELERLAGEDKSPVVRLYLASALQRIPIEQRWPTLERLAARSEDASDHNLPLMYWYAAEPCVASDPVKAVALLKQCRIPLLREFIARRLATSSLKTVANK